jgi:general L-amino acid transport system permease protein
MATLTDPPREAFRLSQLIYDTRYRSMTIQVIAFILIMSALFWLANNTVQNLAALGKDFNFAFLSNRAGYDINQRLIEYSNDSTHGRAALVGILNTLLVAFVGCILATIFGVTAGVLRLSSNWIVARLMSVYVEGFRNIPTLLWILIVFAIMTEATCRNPVNSAVTMRSLDDSFRQRRGHEPWRSTPRLFPSFGGRDERPPMVSAIVPTAAFADRVFLAFWLVGIWGRFAGRWAKARQEATGIRHPAVFWISLDDLASSRRSWSTSSSGTRHAGLS